MCQVCIRELYDTRIKYNFTNIQVHHIIPVAEDYSKRLNDSCLISVCPHHHSMAERGEISREELFEIVKEQEEKNNF
ncbi:HNH endonuclease [Peribacillus kribbensis]|uniref:HNH endonuclease n=1 Tax=Peribacillus kribbensis TaxID=356658 RepID=UPI001FE003AE|nr:HNH endonuclease [Peribacillus kribbensis]